MHQPDRVPGTSFLLAFFERSFKDLALIVGQIFGLFQLKKPFQVFYFGDGAGKGG
jgi:hypothetical protein